MGWIVVDDENDGPILAHETASCATRSEKRTGSAPRMTRARAANPKAKP